MAAGPLWLAVCTVRDEYFPASPVPRCSTLQSIKPKVYEITARIQTVQRFQVGEVGFDSFSCITTVCSLILETLWASPQISAGAEEFFSSCEKDEEYKWELKRVLYSVDLDVWSYKFESEGQIQGLRTTGRADESERERDVFQESERRLPKTL